MTTQPKRNPETEAKLYNERLTFYHANGQGTGTAVQFEPRINQHPGDRYNCFFLDMAPQKTVGRRGEGEPAHATFDWERKVTVKLGFADISELLSVLDGVSDHVGGKRESLYHQSGATNTMIRFSRHDSGGIALSLSRKSADSDEASRVGTILSPQESVGLGHVLRVGLFFITFPGIASTVRT
ncbi:MAG: hypothetical protein HN341_07970 [Verrucomicrobia bacterium]|jgi:hypothetical protein|nr:hypothetical protein [Verrucomicrobiota bacterium]